MDGDWLMCLIVPPDGAVDAAESEPVFVRLDQWNASLILDDGTGLHFDREQLEKALAFTPGKNSRAA